jgi:hypothetical protein
MELAAFELADGGSVLVEVEQVDGVVQVGSRGEVLQTVGKTFEEALSRVRDAAVSALEQFQSMTRRPDEVEITFGVKLDAEVGAVIARTGVEGQLGVKLTWRAPQPPATPAG